MASPAAPIAAASTSRRESSTAARSSCREEASCGRDGAGVAGGGAGAPDGHTGEGSAAGDAGALLQLDINTASPTELEQLDGVGPATAAKIVAYRDEHGPFSSLEELDAVSGIGEAKLAAIRTQLGR